MNLNNIKLESYISLACFLLAMFFKIALVIAIILQFHIISMLQQDSQSTTLFRRYFIAILANIAYIVGLAFVSPSFSSSAMSFYVGFAVAIVSAPILFKFTLHLAKEVALITDNRLFLAIVGFVLVEFIAGLVWVLSYLWHWLGIAHGFRNMDGNAIVISGLGAFVVSVILVFAVFMTDEIHAIKSRDESNESNDPAKSAESAESNKSADSTESTEIAKSNESAESVKSAESTESDKPNESAESNESNESAEANSNESKSTESAESNDSNESTESAK